MINISTSMLMGMNPPNNFLIQTIQTNYKHSQVPKLIKVDRKRSNKSTETKGLNFKKLNGPRIKNSKSGYDWATYCKLSSGARLWSGLYLGTCKINHTDHNFHYNFTKSRQNKDKANHFPKTNILFLERPTRRMIVLCWLPRRRHR